MNQFEDPGIDKNAKKYQCFVCGVMFVDFVEFKEHIIEKHEEGREYIRCPLGRCGAPVRDLKLHFKVKHPTEVFSKVKGPSRALIWKDFSQRRTTKKPHCETGNYTSQKTGKTFHYRSGWELNVYKLLDEDQDVAGFQAEPFQIDYIHKGKARKYIPDILVAFNDGHRELWEIKPANQTMFEQNQNKWHAAEQACQIRGWGWKIITEQEMEKLKRKVRGQYL